MITIHHNFDITKFKSLWAKYVSGGDIQKYGPNCLKGAYSKKFSRKNCNFSPSIVMDEMAAGSFEGIFFCGIIQKGYGSKNLDKINLPHNVHFVIIPQEGAKDSWSFEDWHVEIDGGIVDRIPACYEMSDRLRNSPYDSHFYTCHMFRWMVKHFYPEELRDLKFGFPDYIVCHDEKEQLIACKTEDLFLKIIEHGYYLAEFLFEKMPYEDYESDEAKGGVWYTMQINNFPNVSNIADPREYIIERNAFDREYFASFSYELYYLYYDREYDVPDDKGNISSFYLLQYMCEFEKLVYDLCYLGINEFLDTIVPLQKNNFQVSINEKDRKQAIDNYNNYRLGLPLQYLYS